MSITMPGKKGMTGIFAAVAAAVLLPASCVQTDETERTATYTMGKLDTVNSSQLRGPGVSLKIPFVQSVAKMRVDQQDVTYKGVSTYTKDNQVITAKLTVIYRIPEDQIPNILRNNPDYMSKMEQTVMDSAKSALGQQEAQNVAQNRERIMISVTEQTQRQVKKLLGIQVVDVKMPNFDFDDAFEAAVSQAANAKADLQKKQTELQQAEVDAKKVRVDADAEAYKKQAEAEGEAKGFERIAEAVGRENMDTYLITKKWNGKIPVVAGEGASIVDVGALAASRGPKR